jgi:hypothetical protein
MIGIRTTFDSFKTCQTNSFPMGKCRYAHTILKPLYDIYEYLSAALHYLQNAIIHKNYLFMYHRIWGTVSEKIDSLFTYSISL